MLLGCNSIAFATKKHCFWWAKRKVSVLSMIWKLIYLMLAYTVEALIHNAEEAKRRGATTKRKVCLTSLMAAEITGDRCQTYQKDETNHHSFGF